ncbi:uncharacterized protein LOC123534211 [Mercenaria mercenaria]|uniref:uncharacterized protein LOC123534211 n=1 Tax=Mercenaria mercenaria TaxID=6596 RepID=UPI00234F20E0|nr:uncharacterized protein LOC123534211 [Mercenaria mercenaria]
MMGREASHLTIERVLQDMGYNSLLADFKEMMQNMPLLPETKAVPTGYLGLQTNVCNILPYSAENDRSMNIYALHNSNTPVTNSRSLLQYHEERTRTLYNESLQLQDVASYKSLSIGPAGSERKRPSTDHETDYITDALESKRRRKNKSGKERRTSSTRRRQSTQEPKSRCGSLVKFEDFDKEAIVDLIKRFLPSENQVLKAHEFNLFMDHTVSLVIKKTGEPETVILSMLENDYLEVEKIETKRKDKVYIVYSNNTCLKLGQDEWHCLELYAEYARKRVLNRLKKQSANGFVPSKLLFIKFDGQPVLYNVKIINCLLYVRKIHIYIHVLCLETKRITKSRSNYTLHEPHHEKTTIKRLRPAWIQTNLRIRAVWSGSMLFVNIFSSCNRL